MTDAQDTSFTDGSHPLRYMGRDAVFDAPVRLMGRAVEVEVVEPDTIDATETPLPAPVRKERKRGARRD